MRVDKAAVVFAAEQCELACGRGDAKAASFWTALAFDAIVNVLACELVMVRGDRKASAELAVRSANHGG